MRLTLSQDDWTTAISTAMSQFISTESISATSTITQSTNSSSAWQMIVPILTGAFSIQVIMAATNFISKIVRFHHSPEDFIYIPQEEVEGFGPTQNLAPIDEMIDIEGIVGYDKVTEHYRRLLAEETYRNEQLTALNRANQPTLSTGEQITGIQVAWNEELEHVINSKLEQMLNGREQFAEQWRLSEEKRNEELKRNAEADAKATELFNNVFTPEEIGKLELGQLALVSRNGLTFELTKNGDIYQLLPNGERQHWCVMTKDTHLPLKDILVMKKLLIEVAPELILNAPKP